MAQKSRGAPSGSPTALISQLMFLWQQANPSYEVAPPPIIPQNAGCVHLNLQRCFHIPSFLSPVNDLFESSHVTRNDAVTRAVSSGWSKMPRCKAPSPEERRRTFAYVERRGARERSRWAFFTSLHSIVEFRRQDSPPVVDDHPLLFQKNSLHGKSSLVSAERAVGTDRPVAGDDDGKGVCRQGIAHGPGAPGNARWAAIRPYVLTEPRGMPYSARRTLR